MCLCVSYLTRAQGEKADSLFRTGEFQQAAIAYERAFYDTGEPHYLLQKVYSYKAIKDFDSALRTAQRINTSNDSLEALALYEKVLLYFLKDSYQEAYNELLRYQVYGYAQDFNTEYIRFVSQVQLQDWQNAREQLVSDSVYFGLSDEEIEYILSEDLKKKEISKARTLSYFLPGVGQMYAGYFGKGVVSGLMVTGTIAFTGYSALTGYFFTGMVPGAALFYTFYLGGARYAGQLATRKNLEESDEIVKRFKEVITQKTE
jgi:TM2 domain-containing membrane protein YozV